MRLTTTLALSLASEQFKKQTGIVVWPQSPRDRDRWFTITLNPIGALGRDTVTANGRCRCLLRSPLLGTPIWQNSPPHYALTCQGSGGTPLPIPLPRKWHESCPIEGERLSFVLIAS